MKVSLLGRRNLLAFSAGIDSSALFFMLLEYGVQFDIAIVNYATRENSDAEVLHAKELADKYSLACHSISAPRYSSHFEKSAREFRYSFFRNLATKYGYDTVLTAHQLNDQLEWLLMRLAKGAGLSEIVGIEESSQRDGYTLVRPLLEYSKDELLGYLHENNYPYYIDESNSDIKYERNRFRKEFSDPLMAKYGKGISRSFEYLREDKLELESNYKTIYTIKKLRVIEFHTSNSKVKAADRALKELGYLLSSAQRREIRDAQSIVIGGKWAVELKESLLYIAPYLTTTIPKELKERYRVAKIPKKIRPYLYAEKLDIQLGD